MGASKGFDGISSGPSKGGPLTLAPAGTWILSRPFVAAMRLANFIWVGVGGRGVVGGGDGGENHELTDFCDRDVRGGESRHGVEECEVVGGVAPGGNGKSDGESETTLLHLDDAVISEHGETPSLVLRYWKSTVSA